MIKRDPKETGLETDQSMIKELVDGFVHEVKNPLASIRGALKVLMEKMVAEDPNRKVIEQVHDQVRNIHKALSDLVDFTRISTPEAMLTDINKVLENALQRIRSECRRQEIEVERHLSGNLPEIKIDARQIELAFLYLFLDMLKAMPEGGKLVVRSLSDPMGYIMLEIEDTGISIPEIHMERLFKPFLSTMGRGAGIGLSMARRLLNQNRGLIQAKKRGEDGLTFRIIFPF